MICYKITIYCDNVDCKNKDEAETNDGFDKLKSYFKDEGWEILDDGKIICPPCVYKMGEKKEDKKHPKAKLDEQQVREIKKQLNNGDFESYGKLGKKYGVTGGAIYGIKRGDSWTHV